MAVYISCALVSHSAHINVLVEGQFGYIDTNVGLKHVYCSIINLLWSLMPKMSTMFRSVSNGPCSRTGVTWVASDFGVCLFLILFESNHVNEFTGVIPPPTCKCEPWY